MFTGTSKYRVGSGSMCVLLALLLSSVIQRWHGWVSLQCARSAHAVQTLCLRVFFWYKGVFFGTFGGFFGTYGGFFLVSAGGGGWYKTGVFWYILGGGLVGTTSCTTVCGGAVPQGEWGGGGPSLGDRPQGGVGDPGVGNDKGGGWHQTDLILDSQGFLKCILVIGLRQLAMA